MMRLYAEDDYIKGYTKDVLEKIQLWHSRGHRISSAFGHIERKYFTGLWFFSKTAQTTRHKCTWREERVFQVYSHLSNIQNCFESNWILMEQTCRLLCVCFSWSSDRKTTLAISKRKFWFSGTACFLANVMVSEQLWESVCSKTLSIIGKKPLVMPIFLDMKNATD